MTTSPSPTSASLPAHLVTLVRQGNVALVLGAGASYGAVHPEGKKIPMGPNLKEMIADDFLGGAHRADSLAEIAELAESASSLPALQDYIHDVFDPFQPAAHHKQLPTFRWYGIATLNYDLLIERSYAGTTGQELAPLYSDEDQVEDKRRSPNHLLFLKLHGCITRTHDHRIPLILTPEQYLTHREHRENLFGILEDWAREKTLVFVGTSMQDPDIRQVLLEVGRNSSWRNRHFLVVPDASSYREKFWAERKIELLKMGFADFLQHLDGAIPRLGRTLTVPPTALPCFARFNRTNPALTRAATDAIQNDLEWVHPGMGAPLVSPKDFYRGAAPGWGPLLQNLDVQRHLTPRLLHDIVLEAPTGNTLDFAVIKAPAGSGKTLVLRRAAWIAAADLDALCFYVRAGSLPPGEILCEIAESASRRLFVFVEDYAYNPGVIAQACAIIARRKCPVTLVGTARANEWNVACDQLEPFVSHEYELPYLSQREIADLLALLERHGALGTLEKQSPEDRQRAFVQRAGRQLLVALHEATLGESFERIVRNEFEKLVPARAQEIYLTICALNRTGVPVRAGLVSRLHDVPLSDFKKSFLGPLEYVVILREGKHGVDAEYTARHPYIADMVFREVLNDARSRFDRLAMILDKLNPSYESDQASFEHLVRAQTIREWLPDDVLIDEFYARAEEAAPNDGHVFLQHGIYEMNRPAGDLKRAEELLSRAHELMPKNPITTHAFAELECRLAERAPSGLAAEKHLGRATALATSLTGRNATTSHGYVTLAKAEIIRLRRQIGDAGLLASDETIVDTIRRAETAIADGVQQLGSDAYLSKVEAELANVLADEERATKALEAAVAKSMRNATSVIRLAKTYERRNAPDKAIKLVKSAIDQTPHESRLHATLAELLYLHAGDPLLLEYHLSHAFSPAFPNAEARFMYARQLYINGKLDDAQQQFARLQSDSAAPGLRRGPRAAWEDNGTPKRFHGTVVRMDLGFAFVERDGKKDRIFIRRTPETEFLWTSGASGPRIVFSIAFNLRGPVAVDILPE